MIKQEKQGQNYCIPFPHNLVILVQGEYYNVYTPSMECLRQNRSTGIGCWWQYEVGKAIYENFSHL